MNAHNYMWKLPIRRRKNKIKRLKLCSIIIILKEINTWGNSTKNV